MKKRAIALGAFDGLHVAHAAVLESAVKPGLAPAVLLFDQHPLRLLRGAAPPRLLADEDRDALLREKGLEILKIPFEGVMHFGPRQFFEEILIGQLNAGALCCGYHYRFGRYGAGDPRLLRQLCGEAGITLTVVPLMAYRGEAVSSTRIREALAEGQIVDANKMLGRPFGYAFVVAEGARVGRTLGAPTINQEFPAGFAVPKHGVYASETCIEGQWRASVTNIGLRPTRVRPAEGDCPPQVSETYIINFEGDLYGLRIPVRLLRFLREERVFGSVEELREQIGRDVLLVDS